MKKLILLFGVLFLHQNIYAKMDIDSLLKVLDKVILDKNNLTLNKEAKLSSLKKIYELLPTDDQLFALSEKLFKEYYYYQKDSALNYVQKEIILANRLKDENKLTLAKINLACTKGSIGLYKEALDILSTIDITKHNDLKVDYYNTNAIIYGYLSYYAVSQQDVINYNRLTQVYHDSLLQNITEHNSFYYLAKTESLMLNKKYDMAYEMIKSYFPKTTDIHDKAKLAYNLSQIYNHKNEYDNELSWLAISSINDLKSVTKEYISLRVLAFKLFEEGDIERAYNYMKCSYDDALFCNARLRTFEISQIMPIVNNAYQHQAKTKQNILFYFTLIISLLSVFLLFSIYRIYRQMKKLKATRKELSVTNDLLNILNNQLVETNSTLAESNAIKEEYVAKYMDQCSLYIDKMDEYRKMLYKTATHSKPEDMIIKIKSKDFIEDVLTEFYDNFDKTFLQMFPHFVEELNKLLLDTEQIHLKPGQYLNLELRVYALFRLGIHDSLKIAAFLRCSPNTIYNYRTRNRNNAKCEREMFEDNVMKIGSNNF